jgi:hypothetical protein
MPARLPPRLAVPATLAVAGPFRLTRYPRSLAAVRVELRAPRFGAFG